MTFLTPGNLIFSSQIPNSTFHSRSQVKIGFLLLKFRLFTPRNLIFSALHSKNSKSQVKIGFFFFSEPKFRFFTPTNLIFSSQNPKSKSDFSSQISTIHSKKSVFFSFYSKKSKSQVKTGFFFFSESKFRFFTPKNLFFLLFWPFACLLMFLHCNDSLRAPSPSKLNWMLIFPKPRTQNVFSKTKSTI
mgnify:CR=1 FL=1